MLSHINRLRKSRETSGQATGGVGRPAPNACSLALPTNRYSHSIVAGGFELTS